MRSSRFREAITQSVQMREFRTELAEFRSLLLLLGSTHAVMQVWNGYIHYR